MEMNDLLGTGAVPAAIPLICFFLSILLALASERSKYLNEDSDGSLLAVLSLICLGIGGVAGIRMVYYQALAGDTRAMTYTTGGVTRMFLMAVVVLAACLVIRTNRNSK